MRHAMYLHCKDMQRRMKSRYFIEPGNVNYEEDIVDSSWISFIKMLQNTSALKTICKSDLSDWKIVIFFLRRHVLDENLKLGN